VDWKKAYDCIPWDAPWIFLKLVDIVYFKIVQYIINLVLIVYWRISLI